MRQEDPDAEKFLQYFYDHCVIVLLNPILQLPDIASGVLYFGYPSFRFSLLMISFNVL